MLRKTLLPAATIALLALGTLTARADSAGTGTDPLTTGCYVYAPSSVNEGQTFTTTIKCHGLASSVFGVQFGTDFTPTTGTVDGVSATAVAAPSATTYIPGSFAPTNFLSGDNRLSALYAVSHEGSTTSTGDFTLATFDSSAPAGLTSGDGSVSIDMRDVKLSDINGAPLSVTLPSSAISVTIKDIVIALRHAGSLTVQSDGSMTALRSIVVSLDGGNPATVNSASGSSKVISIGAYQYPTDKTSAAMSISMVGHLSCTRNVTLSDGPNAASIFGTSDTLKAGDANADGSIDISDATLVGGYFNTSRTDGSDINGDGTVDIYDLVHIGRNYTATAGSCS